MALLYTDANQCTWSNEKMALVYHRHSPSLKSESSRVGLISVFPERFGDTRWIHWESDGALVCLRELSLNGFVLDSSLCLKTDGCEIIDVFVDCQSNEEYHIVLVASNGDLLQLTTHSTNPLKSILESAIKDSEGVLQHAGYQYWCRGADVSVLAGRQVLSATRVGRHTLALGLSRGDAVCVFLGPLAKNNGAPRYGPLLKDASIIQSLLSSTRLFNSAENSQDTLAVGAIDATNQQHRGGAGTDASGSGNGVGLFLAVNAAGYIRIWNASTEQSVSITCLNELVQVLNASDSGNRGFNSTERDLLRLQQVLVRGSVITSDNNEQYLMVVVATLQIENSFNNKPHWQICTLLAKFNSPRDIGKFHLLITPLTSQSLTGAFHDLTDLQLHHTSGGVRLLCSWRSNELDTVLTSSELLLDFELLRNFVTSGQMRSDLCTVTSSTLENDIAAARNALIAEDQLLMQYALTGGTGVDANVSTLGEVLKRVEVVLLQRVFLTSRYSPQTITAALRSFTRRHGELSEAQVAVVEAFAAQELSFACEHNESFASRAPKVLLDLLKQVALLRVLYLNSLGTGNESSNAFINVFLEVCSDFLVSCNQVCKLLEVGAAGSMGALAVAPASGKILIAQRRGGAVCVMSLNAAPSSETAAGAAAAAATEGGVVEALLAKVSAVLRDNHMYRLMETTLQQIDQSDKQSVLKLLEEVASLATAENLPGVTSLLSQLGEVTEDLLKQLSQHCTECNELHFTGLEDWSAFTHDGKIQNLAGAIVNVLHIYLVRTKQVSVLFALLLKHGRGIISETGFVRIRDFYLPKIVNQLCFLSLVLWLNVVRPTNNFIAKHNVETTKMMSLLLGTAETFSPLDLYLDLPLLTNYIHHHMNQLTLETLLNGSADSVQECWISVAKDTLTSLNPFTSDDFALFLFQSGQYAVLQRWSQVLESIHSSAILTANVSANAAAFSVSVSAGEDCRFPLHTTVQEAPAFQAITSLYPGALRAMASLCESLRCRTSYHQDGTQLDEVLTEEFSCALNGELNNLTAWSHRFSAATEQPATFLLTAAVEGEVGTPSSFQQHTDELTELHEKVSDSCDPAARGGVMVFFGVLHRLLKRPLFQVFMSSLKEDATSTSKQPSRFLSVLHEYSFWLYHIVSVYHLMDLIEVLERTQLILSHREGLTQIIQVCLALSNTLETLLTALSEIPRGADRSSGSVGQSVFGQTVYQSLHDCWAKVFEYSLLLGEANCPFALDAVHKLIDLEEDPLFCESLVVRSTWRQCLNALINHACDCGQLGWLCSLTDTQLGSFSQGKQPLRLVDVIAQELEYLTTDCVTESYAVEKVFYFECLTTFLLVHGRFADVVRVVDSVTTSLESSSSRSVYSQSEDLLWWQAVAVQALAALPPSEQVVLKQESLRLATGGNVEKTLTLLDQRNLNAKFTDRMLGHDAVVTLAQPMHSEGLSENVVCADLCTRGLYNTALTLARRHNASDLTFNGQEMVDLILVQLANDCCLSEGANGGRTVRDAHQAPFVTDVTSTPAGGDGDVSVLHCAALLKDCLSELVSNAHTFCGDSGDSGDGVRVTSSSNHHHSLCLLLVAMLSADAPVAVSFVGEYVTYLRGLTDKQVIAARVTDVLTLIRLCVRDKDFILACNLTLILLTIGSNDSGAAASAPGGGVDDVSGTPHYNAVDLVISEAEAHLGTLSADDSMAKALKSILDEVKKRLKEVFTKALMDSMSRK